MKNSKLYSGLLILALLACTNKPVNTTTGQPVKFDPVTAQIFTTARDTSLRLTQTADVTFEEFGQPFETQVCVFVDPANTFQTMIGIGGALTDASAEVYAKLPEAAQKEFMTAYYDSEKGIGYKFSRTNIASCDFSSDTYGYIAENDTSLILLKYSQVWANHYVKFIKAYESLGIPVWGLSVQNEPMAKQIWESCLYTADDERDFIKNFLGPTLQKNGMGDKKLIAWDHNRDLVYQRAKLS